MGEAVAIAVGLHVTTALPSFLTYGYVQSDWSQEQPNPPRHDLMREPSEVFNHESMAPHPDTPGLGIELNNAILKRYALPESTSAQQSPWLSRGGRMR